MKAASGVPQQPNVFYVGATNGGVWKTTDYGVTWNPIFDDQPTGSIGALAVAPSDPNIIYVGSGEGLQRPDLSTGDGIYKSTDAGKTWTHLGLRDGQQIPQIIVDPKDPNRLFVAVLGHPYGPNEERGIFRSTDGGRSFQKVLYKDDDTGGADLAFDPANPQHVYAVMWEARQGPWENGVFTGPGSGLFESTDGGTNWKPLTKGLPTFENGGLGRIGIAVAPSDPKRMFATVQAGGNLGGLFRSDDAGQSWYKATENALVVSRGDDFAEVKVHPKNPDIVFTGSIVSWKSTDGGKTFRSFRGAPGGDDYHRIWINPDNPDIILLAADQGAVITVNGGETWSSWYNQPTAQFYHVSTDNAFPYRVCGGQQESGSACVQSRSDDGRITFREWHPVGVEEYGYVAPDPLDPDIVYGGKVSRYDRRTGEVIQVGPRAGAGRRLPRRPDAAGAVFADRSADAVLRVEPLVEDDERRHARLDGDQSRSHAQDVGRAGQRRRLQGNGRRRAVPARRHLHDRAGLHRHQPPLGRHRRRADSHDRGRRRHVEGRDAAGADAVGEGVDPRRVAHQSARRLRGDQHASGSTISGRTSTARATAARRGRTSPMDCPTAATINTVKEDPKKKGLLFAGSETQVYVSFDDGDRWHSLRQNMPATSIRDLVIKDDDLDRRHARARLLDSRRHLPRCARSTRRRSTPAPSCSSPAPRSVSSGTRTPIRRWRRGSRRDRIRRTARSSTTS